MDQLVTRLLPFGYAAEFDIGVAVFLERGRRTGGPSAAVSKHDERSAFRNLGQARFELVHRDVVVALDGPDLFKLFGTPHVEQKDLFPVSRRCLSARGSKRGADSAGSGLSPDADMASLGCCESEQDTAPAQPANVTPN